MVEMKYHEDLRGTARPLKPRYLEVARASGAFLPEKIDAVARSDLQQLWLDHLLARATLQTDELETSLFVVIYPEINVRCHEAVARYREALSPLGAYSFEARTLESLIETVGAVVGEAWTREFAGRYLARPAE
jgi:hypothetical protein